MDRFRAGQVGRGAGVSCARRLRLAVLGFVVGYFVAMSIKVVHHTHALVERAAAQ